MLVDMEPNCARPDCGHSFRAHTNSHCAGDGDDNCMCYLNRYESFMSIDLSRQHVEIVLDGVLSASGRDVICTNPGTFPRPQFVIPSGACKSITHIPNGLQVGKWYCSTKMNGHYYYCVPGGQLLDWWGSGYDATVDDLASLGSVVLCDPPDMTAS